MDTADQEESPLGVPNPLRQPLHVLSESSNFNSEKMPPPITAAKPTWLRKLGKYAILILLVGTVALLGAICLASSLWISADTNSTWRAIILGDYLTVSVTILAETMKQAVSFLVGILAAMLAAISLERSDILLKDAASMLSIWARSGAGSILELCLMHLRRINRPSNGTVFFPIFAVLAALAFSFSQVIRIIPASDLGLQPMPEYPALSATRLGWASATGPVKVFTRSDKDIISSVWLRRAAAYPTFAEYSEPPGEEDGIKDTDVTLRAFLPYSSAQMREETFEYEGRTIVLDARVTCQVPDLQHQRIETIQGGGPLILTGTGKVRAPRKTPLLGTTTVSNPQREFERGCDVFYDEAMDFSCIVPTQSQTEDEQVRTISLTPSIAPVSKADNHNMTAQARTSHSFGKGTVCHVRLICSPAIEFPESQSSAVFVNTGSVHQPKMSL